MEMERLEEVVREAGELALRKMRENAVHVKGRGDFVTDADLAVSSFLEERLPALAPGSVMVSEEGDTNVPQNGKLFIVDPIDGTTNLMYGLRLSAISVAYREEGELRLAVVYNPFTDELFKAEKGKGAKLNGSEIHVSRDVSLDDALIGVEAGPATATRQKAYFERLFQLHAMGRGLRLTGSAALDLCYVACGRLSACAFHYLYPWDYAAGWLILNEAGGSFTDRNGDPPPFAGRVELLYGSNGALQPQLLRAMQGAEG
ncbi:MAG: inositol monophosphatase [Clostridia bacterium]|nr:inositol monophosphatase [Clostridia bacterium]